MTTKLAYQIRSVINYDKLDFNPDEPEPYDMFQYPTLQEVLHVLDAHITSLHPSEDVFRSSNTFICYDPSNLNVRVAPDFYAAFGVDASAIESRKLYLPWEAGKSPDFALEVASESTSRRDINFKRRLYAEIGIAEYWRFDRTGGDFYGQPLAGDRLENGVYQPIELTTEPDGCAEGLQPSDAAEPVLARWQPEVLSTRKRPIPPHPARIGSGSRKSGSRIGAGKGRPGSGGCPSTGTGSRTAATTRRKLSGSPARCAFLANISGYHSGAFNSNSFSKTFCVCTTSPVARWARTRAVEMPNSSQAADRL